MTLSIIIPTKNASLSIVTVLQALYRGIDTAGISAEIIIVDGGSRDDTCGIIARLTASWRTSGLFCCIEDGETGLEGIRIVESENEQVGKMIHRGFLRSSGSFCLFTTQDLLLVPYILNDSFASLMITLQ